MSMFNKSGHHEQAWTSPSRAADQELLIKPKETRPSFKSDCPRSLSLLLLLSSSFIHLLKIGKNHGN